MRTDAEKPLRVLFADPAGIPGHRALYNAFIRALLDRGAEVDLAFARGVALQNDLMLRLSSVPLPASQRSRAMARFSARYVEWRNLRAIRRHCRGTHYDFVILSVFDELALFAAHMRTELVLVVHANAAGLDNSVKRILFKRLARRAKFVVFHEFIRDRLACFGIHDVTVEPQGIGPAFPAPTAITYKAVESLDPRLTPAAEKVVLFMPWANKFGHGDIAGFWRHHPLQRFLAERNAVLVAKGLPDHPLSPNIVAIRRELTDAEYQSLFAASRCVILNYPPSFAYRVSAILHECFSNQKPCLVSDIESFRAFRPHFRYEPYFQDVGSLMAGIATVLALAPEIARAPYQRLQALEPSFCALLAEATSSGVTLA